MSIFHAQQAEKRQINGIFTYAAPKGVQATLFFLTCKHGVIANIVVVIVIRDLGTRSILLVVLTKRTRTT
jgi:hypothetical protein